MKMKISVISLFPELIRAYLSDALLSKALANSLMSVRLVNLRDFSDNKYKSVDDTPFGGGDGMLLRADILEKALLSLCEEGKKQKVIYLSPQGTTLSSQKIQEYALDLETELVLICGRYAGVDERFIQKYVDQEISIGDYVLSGGELPALVLIEAVSRFVPGVLGDRNSSEADSFQQGLLEAPQYTRPQVWNGLNVPEVLVSGHHALIENWKNQSALEVTRTKRPDLYEKYIQNQKGKK